MNKRLKQALLGLALIGAGYLTGNPAVVTVGVTSVVSTVQEMVNE
ncbi:hypothetical protein ER16_Medium1 [Pseudomonas phage ER16]|nr:hypothetical protein ER16_Medium1 [Pseudomonas phage ER16]